MYRTDLDSDFDGRWIPHRSKETTMHTKIRQLTHSNTHALRVSIEKGFLDAALVESIGATFATLNGSPRELHQAVAVAKQRAALDAGRAQAHVPHSLSAVVRKLREAAALHDGAVPAKPTKYVEVSA